MIRAASYAPVGRQQSDRRSFRHGHPHLLFHEGGPHSTMSRSRGCVRHSHHQALLPDLAPTHSPQPSGHGTVQADLMLWTNRATPWPPASTHPSPSRSDSRPSLSDELAQRPDQRYRTTPAPWHRASATPTQSRGHEGWSAVEAFSSK